MLIHIKSVSKETIDLDFDSSPTIFDIRERISKVKECEIAHVILIFNGKKFESSDDSLNASEFNIKDGDNLVMLIRKPKNDTVEPPTPTPALESVPNNIQEVNMQEVIMGMLNTLQNDPVMIANLLQQNAYLQNLSQNNPSVPQPFNNPQFIENVSLSLGSLTQSGEEATEVALSDNEKKDVDDLVELGFPFSEALEMYNYCGKNKELAANNLLS